jgi:hypothetical protein
MYVCMYIHTVQELVEKDANRLGLVCRLCSQRHSLLEDEPLTLSLMDELSPALPTDEVGWVNVCMYVCTSVCMYVLYVSMYVCMYVCIDSLDICTVCMLDTFLLAIVCM